MEFAKNEEIGAASVALHHSVSGCRRGKTIYMHQPERNTALLLLAAQANYTFILQLACMEALAKEEE